MHQPLRVALVGCGSVGSRHALAYVTSRHLVASARVVAVCDRDIGRARRVAGGLAVLGHPAPVVCGDVTELPDDVQAVDVTVPPAAHHAVAVQAMARGRHVLVEKPLALTMPDAVALTTAAHRAGVVLAVAENYRRIAANRRLRSALADRGGARTVRTEIAASPHDEAARNGASWYGDPAIGGSFLIHEIGSHEVDLVRYLAGEVATVAARASGAPRPDPWRASVVSALLHTVSGAHVHLTLRTDPTPVSGVRHIDTARGALISEDWRRWDGTAVDERGAVHRLIARQPPLDRDDPHAYGITAAVCDFVDAATGDRRPEIDGVDGARTLAVCTAIVESVERGRPVGPAGLLAGAGAAPWTP